jgi:tetratricopeptide (TPR) repeat protein
MSDEETAMALSDQAGTLLLSGEVNQAISLLERAAALAPENGTVLFNLARAYKNNGDSERAESSLRALLARPEAAAGGGPLADAAVLLGLIRYEAGDLAAARSLYERALSLEPGNADALNDLGVVEFNLGDYRAARSRFAAASRANPGLTSAWLNLEDACEELRDREGQARARAREAFPPDEGERP